VPHGTQNKKVVMVSLPGGKAQDKIVKSSFDASLKSKDLLRLTIVSAPRRTIHRTFA
jgi:hypothetical protein